MARTTTSTAGILWVCGFVGAALSSGAGPASARGTQLAALEDIRAEGTRRAVFVLTRPGEIEIEAVGAADRRGESFLAHAWILDLGSRAPVWTQDAAPGERARRSGNWVTRDVAELPAGTYAVYFSAHSASLPIDAEIKVLGIQLGRLSGDLRRHREWDDLGDPEDWGVWVWGKDPGLLPGPVPSVLPEPHPHAPIRFLGLGDGVMEEVRFDLSRQVELVLEATGEYVRGTGYFADTIWLTDRDRWERVFTLTKENTEPAGGAEKNRRFSGRIRLEAGSYALAVATDQTHANGSWNEAPPWDPDAWGVSLDLADPADGPALTVLAGAARPEPAVAIERVRNGEFRSERFTVERSARLLVRATGEQVDDELEFADAGWIERVADLEEVWWMDGNLSYPAGGARKNRLVEEVIELPAGDYLLCYATDDSHAYRDWNLEGPYDPEFWGITLAEVNPGVRPALQPGGSAETGAFLSIAPVGDGQHIVKRFEVSAPTRVRVIALGEGTDGEMHDYAWLEAGDTGRALWKMEFDETGRAGGAVKNRQVQVDLSLPAGVYALHYTTDGSHAFGDWNSPPPRRPHLWGVTLLELPDETP